MEVFFFKSEIIIIPMIFIQNIRLPITHKENELQQSIAVLTGLPFEKAVDFTVVKRSVDSRKKRQMIYFVYSVLLSVENENEVIATKTIRKNSALYGIEIRAPYHYPLPRVSSDAAIRRPVIVGSGPCGLFAALVLVRAGLKPLLIERGGDIDSRMRDVSEMISAGKLNCQSNLQFGEGGAGTFSDGKLNTLITNPRIKFIFNEFVAAGAPENILFEAQPHIGTDKLRNVVKNIREQITGMGGEVLFNTRLTDVIITGNKVSAVVLDGSREIKTDTLILAIGHSARDTYEMLYKRNITMIQKAFSIGVRIEHKAEMINQAQYAEFYKNERLGPARYKLAVHSEHNRSVYTFCMCPGGYVMPAASEEGGVVTNGMSEYARSGENSNSALLVNVGPGDFPSEHPLAGIEFQRKLEQKAFLCGGGGFFAPVQLVGDFLRKQPSRIIKSVTPSYRPGISPGSLDGCLPDYVLSSLREALPKLEKKLEGFAHPDAVMTAVETRSSAPVRMVRDEVSLQTNISGIYPAGEGAGYAGGIISSAADGIRVSEKIIQGLINNNSF